MSLVDDLRQMVMAGTAEFTLGTATYWSDAQLTSVMGRHRELVEDQRIEWHPQRATGGTVTYLRGSLSGQLAFEAGTAAATSGTVLDGTGSSVTGWTLERDGWITWASNQAGSAYYYTGWTYDLNSAAAEVCDTWMMQVKTLVDVSTDDQSLKLSQKATTLKLMADDFRRKAPLRTTEMCRDDAL